jgi:replicative DNA helicase
MADNWEKMVIGTALADPASMAEAEILIPSDFTGINQLVWSEVMELHRRNALDLRTFMENIRNSGVFEQTNSDVGTAAQYITDIMRFSTSSMPECVDRVLNTSIRRELKRSLALITAEADNDLRKAEDLVDYAEKQVLALRRGRQNEGTSLGDIIDLFIPRMNAMIAGTAKPAWVPKVQAVKDILDYVEGSDFITVAARPGDGKSSYCRYEALHRVLGGGRVLLFNLENDPIEYARYSIALLANIDSQKLKNPKDLTEEELDRVKQASDTLGCLPLNIITMASPSVDMVVRTAKQMINKEKFDFVIVDYLQLINNGIENKVDDLAQTTSQLRALSLEMNVPVMANSQLSRSIETRGPGSDPMLSDLRSSGSIEQDSTIVMFMRNLWTNPTQKQKMLFPENVDPATHQMLDRMKVIPIQFHVAKNRNGEIGVSAPVKWNKATGDFQTLDNDKRMK